ncbi:luc7-like protein 3 [Paramacrobiotus metropolitanus]|uniref:luc7-like protein 3 n=1 Tax=Paramacrobiotus metropolitanus TaxID=2943436 RepID=UPI0024464E56|nr:luc7-like protein 3 [Paramacrobiotus metropolitanus]XP_055328389.1 luc7-like protein 3 [Paramacrobiotus metropolitanus]XP_055328390.1 luc7-like protein 3 [Paramacrobiotus metropolitanus]
MARDFMAQMLDELMGRNRNAAPNERKELRWDDESVCKHFLANYCPNELFTNTKADLGICKLLHDEEMKKRYQSDRKKGTMGYESDFFHFLRTMVQDVDRRIDRGKDRLEATKQVSATNTGTKYDDKVKDLSQKIEDLVQEAERLGTVGRVEEAQSKLRQSDQLRKDLDGLKATLELAVQQEKQLEVCQTCGAFLIVGDAQQRIDDHLAGKQHVGYAKIRQTLKDEEDRVQKELEDRRKEREHRHEDRGNSRGRSEKRDERSSKNGRDRSRDKSKRSDSRERRRRSSSRDRNRRRSRSRSNSRRKVDSGRRRSRSRSKDRREKRDSKQRSRSRDSKRRRSHSRSKDDKKRRSRSREEKDRRRHRDGSVSSNKSKTSNSKQDIAAPNNVEAQLENTSPVLDAIELPKGNTPSEMQTDE